MRFIIQRVKSASVTVSNELVSKIGPGLMILVGLTHDDKEEYLDQVTEKFLNLRLWDDSKGVRWKESVRSQNFEILFVSQFTLYYTMKGNKPDFHLAMENDKAKILFDKLIDCIKKKYDENKIKTGKFGEYMNVELVNDGPVTLNWEYPGNKIENMEKNGTKIKNENKNAKDNNGKKDKENKKEDKKKKDKKEKNKKEKDKKEEDKKEEDKKEEDKKEKDKKEEDKKEEDKKEEDKNEEDKKEEDKKE